MTFTPEITAVTQRVQIGAETTPGTGVAASKLLECFDFTPGIDGDVVFYTPTGHKYPTEQEENTEWVAWTMGGNMDYNGALYPLGGVFGVVTPVAHLSSATAKDWVYTPPLSSNVQPQTYTIEQGDSTRARKSAYNLFTDFSYTLTRQKVDNTGKLFSQPISDGITLTGSPTAIAMAPIAGKHWNIYLDSTSGGLGTTQLLKVLQVQFAFTGAYGMFWPLNRANLGYTSHVDLKPTCTVKLLLEADATGMGILSHMQDGSTWWLRCQAQGAQIASDGPGAVFNTFQHDMAVKFDKPQPFSDSGGVYAIEWGATIVEDPTWGKAHTLTVTNLITAL